MYSTISTISNKYQLLLLEELVILKEQGFSNITTSEMMGERRYNESRKILEEVRTAYDTAEEGLRISKFASRGRPPPQKKPATVVADVRVYLAKIGHQDPADIRMDSSLPTNIDVMSSPATFACDDETVED
jgi:hypothetical protein